MKQVTTSFTKRFYLATAITVTLLATLASGVLAQSLTITALGDTIQSSSPNRSLGVWYHAQNTTNDTLHLVFRTERTSVPSGWGVSMCVGSACYPEFIDSVLYDIPPLTLDSCALDLYVGDEVGLTASARITIQRIGTSEFYARTVTVTSTDAPEAAQPVSHFLSSVYPNPFNSNSVLQIVSPNRGNVTIALYDVMGRLLSATNIAAVQGMNTVPLQAMLRERTAGYYFLQVTTPYGNRTHRITYLR